MLIACPACGTKYVVPDDALGVEGRTVRCAKCKHSWFQDGPEIAYPQSDAGVPDDGGAILADPPPAPPMDRHGDADDGGYASGAAREAAPPPSHGNRRSKSSGAAEPDADVDAPMPSAVIDPPPFYRAPDRTAEPAGVGHDKPDEADYSSFDYEPPFRPRRNRLRLFTIAGAGFAALAFLALAAMQVWGAPSWLPTAQPRFASEEPGLTMSFPDDRQQTRTLPTGGKFLAVSGTIANTGRETRSVPPILILLRDERNRVVYSHAVASPSARLAPGESEEVNEAIADIPESAVAAEFGWAPR